ncbi:sensor histidine kinase [Emticicia sp. CRIBPO]|uniref:sensor histidine kinase n=1 Tax=Emticicia sp. CRIBPO TaxID=2683258 RepID=UPI001412BD78|nr:histidine kinase [Emticicia sp. CRIBPO]NBA87190.1 sensor histidine kinase [Emticicia sp. CRIBPO]
MNFKETEILFTFFAAIVILLILAVSIIIFAFIFQRRQAKLIKEKTELKAQFEKEILTSQNEIQEQTMKDISRELHDNVGQMLSLVKIQLNNLQEDLPDNLRIVQSKEYLNAALNDLRSLSKTLNNDNILNDGLGSAIRFELERVDKAGLIKTSFVENQTGTGLENQKALVVFRMFQEQLQNTLKHAQAKNLWVVLQDSPESFKLELSDDGTGFDFESKIKLKGFNNGSGLANLIHRAKLLGGEFKIESTAGSGTKTDLMIPKISQ